MRLRVEPKREILCGGGFSLVISAVIFCFCSCKVNQARPFIIWTDNASLVFGTELFNEQHRDSAAFLVYKENLSDSFPPEKGEDEPDLVIGSYLKNSQTRRYFSSLDYIFSANRLDRAVFLPNALEYGQIASKQYLIPVSFNLPMVIFSSKEEDTIDPQNTVTLERIKELSNAFNEKDSRDEFVKMGFAPSWDINFLYLVTRINGVGYNQKGRSFIWNSAALNDAISYLRDWSSSVNGGAQHETDFQFKYLYMPKRAQVTQNRSLFAYTQSSEFFKQDQSLISDLSFRWIENNSILTAEDDTVCLGLYKKAKRKTQAVEFISWFFSKDTQSLLLERISNININTKSFGIVGGFSSVASVNEDILPVYYRGLLGNLPHFEDVEFSRLLPPDWKDIKDDVLYPYLEDAYTVSGDSDHGLSLQERLSRTGRRVYVN